MTGIDTPRRPARTIRGAIVGYAAPVLVAAGLLRFLLGWNVESLPMVEFGALALMVGSGLVMVSAPLAIYAAASAVGLRARLLMIGAVLANFGAIGNDLLLAQAFRG